MPELVIVLKKDGKEYTCMYHFSKELFEPEELSQELGKTLDFIARWLGKKIVNHHLEDAPPAGIRD